MAHFLIIDDHDFIRVQWRAWLEEQGHTCQEADDCMSAVETIVASEGEGGEPFDILLVDHDLQDGNYKGWDVLKNVNRKFPNYSQDRFIVITGSRDLELIDSYTEMGSLNHLLKPTEKDQFLASVKGALCKRSFVEQKGDWESAVELLQNLELLPNIERMQQDLEAFEVLRATYQSLMEDLERFGGNESKLRASYNNAYQAIISSSTRLDSIIPFLEPFQITRSLWEDIEYTFAHERLKFHGLQCYLARIANNPTAYSARRLGGDAPGHYEYRIGQTHRLYFRYGDDSIVLERFGHKNRQPEIMRFLRSTGGGDIYQLPRTDCF